MLRPSLRHYDYNRGVTVLVDGAHAVGSLPISMSAMQPDFYVGNCHKWLCAPKGVGFMYIRRDLQASIHPVITSHGYGAGLHSEFSWQGESVLIEKPTIVDNEATRQLSYLLIMGINLLTVLTLSRVKQCINVCKGFFFYYLSF